MFFDPSQVIDYLMLLKEQIAKIKEGSSRYICVGIDEGQDMVHRRDAMTKAVKVMVKTVRTQRVGRMPVTICAPNPLELDSVIQQRFNLALFISPDRKRIHGMWKELMIDGKPVKGNLKDLINRLSKYDAKSIDMNPDWIEKEIGLSFDFTCKNHYNKKLYKEYKKVKLEKTDGFLDWGIEYLSEDDEDGPRPGRSVEQVRDNLLEKFNIEMVQKGIGEFKDGIFENKINSEDYYLFTDIYRTLGINRSTLNTRLDNLGIRTPKKGNRVYIKGADIPFIAY